MPCLLLNACELVNYRPSSSWFLSILILCLTTLPGSSATMKSVCSETKAESCAVDGCQDCSPRAVPSRPYFRNALARSVYSKILVDEEFKKFDKTKVKHHLLLTLQSHSSPSLQHDESFTTSPTLMENTQAALVVMGAVCNES